VTDFGLSRDEDQLAMASSTRLVGNCRWMAPELHADDIKSKASDVFAFAMVVVEVRSLLYENKTLLNSILIQILSGDIPFASLNFREAIINKITSGKRPAWIPSRSPQGVPYTPIWRVAAEAWRQEPEDRPDIFKVLAKLRRIADPQATSSWNGNGQRPVRPVRGSRAQVSSGSQSFSLRHSAWPRGSQQEEVTVEPPSQIIVEDVPGLGGWMLKVSSERIEEGLQSILNHTKECYFQIEGGKMHCYKDDVGPIICTCTYYTSANNKLWSL
jgi:hypothetical protein